MIKLDFSEKKIGDFVIFSNLIINKGSEYSECEIVDISNGIITCKIIYSDSENGKLRFHQNTGVQIYRDYETNENELSSIRFYPDIETALLFFKTKNVGLKISHFSNQIIKNNPNLNSKLTIINECLYKNNIKIILK